MIYAMSDIHGCISELQKQMEMVDLSGGEGDRLIFLGDYIDYGDSSYQGLKYIWDLQKKFGEEKVIVLKGNHEQMFLEWINDHMDPYSDGIDDYLTFNDWLHSDLEYGAHTISTFLSEQQMDQIYQILRTCPLKVSKTAAQMLLSDHKELIRWMKKMPLYYETKDQIYVHAGVDEEAEEYWKWGTSEDIFLGKFPATKGEFSKTIIAGHIGTDTIELAGDSSYHDVYYDGKSHYYIDGAVYKGGKLLLFACDEDSGKCFQVENGKMIPVRPFEKHN